MISGNAGDVISYDFNFLTREAPTGSRDFAFSTIRSGEEGEVVRDDALLMTRSSTSNPNWSQSGWQSVSYALAATGNVTVGFGAVDVLDTKVHTRLLIDNARKTPVPSTGLMLGVGLLELAVRGGPGRR